MVTDLEKELIRNSISKDTLEVLHAWFKFQSQENTSSLYNHCSKLFGSTFNPAEYDDVE